MVESFRVVRCNYGHWDILVNGEDRLTRAFAIRGGPGDYYVRDERNGEHTTQKFATVQACMSYICDALMWELLVAEGQHPHVIEAWNIGT